MTQNLALFGGEKTIPYEMPAYRSLGAEETQAVQAVMEDGALSRFIGAWHEDYLGGPRVREFERAWEEFFKTKYAVSVNSCTSGLICALGACGIEPGDEVMVSPWTMCATATSILVWNAIPVFVDIEPETFCIDPSAVENLITPKTRAIVVTDIFGHSAQISELMKIAKKHGLLVIEDAAQAPGALISGHYAGTVADIGVYSLNYHKHIHTGEGGMCVTNDPKLADRMQMIRNHGEAVAAKKPTTDFSNLIGFNFRMGEIEAAIGIEQLKKLRGLAASKTLAGEQLSFGLKDLPGLKVPLVRKDCTHVFYVYAFTVDFASLKVTRKKLAEALRAEGIPAIMEGYQNVHLLPMYQKRIAYGTKGYPWSEYESQVSYEKGICPVAEKLHDQTMLGLPICSARFNPEDTSLVIEAFQKVWENLDTLK